MASHDDLQTRIARLEQLLDDLDRSRNNASADAVAKPASQPIDRLRELASLLARDSDQIDEADAIAMRSLLHELHATVAGLRDVAADTDRRLTEVAAAYEQARAQIKAIEEIG